MKSPSIFPVSTSVSSVLSLLIVICTLGSFVVPIHSQQQSSESSNEGTKTANWYTIEGKVNPPLSAPKSGGKGHDSWISQVQILVNGGEHTGFLKEDGSFIITGVQAGSYIIDVIHPQMSYESARVDITSRGKIRARKVNYLQPSQVSHLPYPLRLSSTGPYRYFQVREQWRITDVLLSPMVLMMVLPLVLIVILPKMMSDPETRREMEQVSLPKYEMPEMSEMITNFFGGAKSSDSDKKGQKSIKSKKNN